MAYPQSDHEANASITDKLAALTDVRKRRRRMDNDKMIPFNIHYRPSASEKYLNLDMYKISNRDLHL